MALKTKTIKIGEFDINIIQFNALEALKLRKDLFDGVKNQLDSDVALENSTGVIKGIATILYGIPGELLMKLFKNCSAIDVGELNNQTNFNKVFENNLDGTIELAMEVLDFNGFFSLNILTILVKKITMLAPMEESIQQALSEMKKN